MEEEQEEEEEEEEDRSKFTGEDTHQLIPQWIPSFQLHPIFMYTIHIMNVIVGGTEILHVSAVGKYVRLRIGYLFHL